MYEQEFEELYKEFLKGDKDVHTIIKENQSNLNIFLLDHNLDNKSIYLLPAFFNFIECYLDLGNDSEVKRYLIVGLSNLMFSAKAKEETKDEDDIEGEEQEDIEKDRNAKRSRLDLLFARFNLNNSKWSDAIEKLSNSIVLYSQIFGPESIGLTPHYYYLANYFAEKPLDPNEKWDKREVIIKNIYSKIAEIWRKFFIGDVNEFFESK